MALTQVSKTYLTMIDLKKENGDENTTVELLGYYEPYDGGGGIFYWDNSSSANDNMGTIIEAKAVTGRWLRVYHDLIHVKWFGAKGSGDPTDDDTTSINAAVKYCVPLGLHLKFDNGDYQISGAIEIPSGKGWTISGASKGATTITQITDGKPIFNFLRTTTQKFKIHNLNLTWKNDQKFQTESSAFLFTFTTKTEDGHEASWGIYNFEIFDIAIMYAYRCFSNKNGMNLWGWNIHDINAEDTYGSFMNLDNRKTVGGEPTGGSPNCTLRNIYFKRNTEPNDSSYQSFNESLIRTNCVDTWLLEGLEFNKMALGSASLIEVLDGQNIIIKAVRCEEVRQILNRALIEITTANCTIEGFLVQTLRVAPQKTTWAVRTIAAATVSCKNITYKGAVITDPDPDPNTHNTFAHYVFNCGQNQLRSMEGTKTQSGVYLYYGSGPNLNVDAPHAVRTLTNPTLISLAGVRYVDVSVSTPTTGNTFTIPNPILGASNVLYFFTIRNLTSANLSLTWGNQFKLTGEIPFLDSGDIKSVGVHYDGTFFTILNLAMV